MGFGLQNLPGLMLIRMPSVFRSAVVSKICCFFELDSALNLQPQDVITDFCDSWNLDGGGDIEPEPTPADSGCWKVDSNGDLMPYQ